MTAVPLLQTSAPEVLFILVGLVALGAAVMVVTTRNVVHAALWLVVALGALAAEYVLLTAEFVAWVQVLVYVGAVVVLLLFGAMLTRAPIGSAPDLDSGNRWAASLVAGATAGTLASLLATSIGGAWIDLDRARPGSATSLGHLLFRNAVLPFEVVSLLLLAALVGAVVLSRSDVSRGED